MSRPTPRRPSTSRAPTPRPRKLAGGQPPTSSEKPADEAETEPDVPDEPPPPPDSWPVEGPEDGDGRSALRSTRVTRMLLILVGVLAVILVLQAIWGIRHEWFRDEPKVGQAAEGTIDVPSDRPVLPTELSVQAGVEAAAKAAEKIVNRTYQNYDKEVDAATALMTPDFAEEYQQTTDDVREAFIARKTTVQVRVVAQGVVRANDTELQALLFLNQFVGRNQGKDPKTSITAYRALLTMVNTEDGWLVDDLQTE